MYKRQQLHVFSYSERPGTQALKIDYVVSPEEKHQRSQRLLTLSDEKTRAFYTRHIGQTMQVLMEKSKAGTPMHGFTANYIRVEVENDESLDNQMKMCIRDRYLRHFVWKNLLVVRILTCCAICSPIPY